MLTDPLCPGGFVQNPMAPSMYFSKEFDVLMDLHVDDGYFAGPKEKLTILFDYLTQKMVIKVGPLLRLVKASTTLVRPGCEWTAACGSVLLTNMRSGPWS